MSINIKTSIYANFCSHHLRVLFKQKQQSLNYPKSHPWPPPWHLLFIVSHTWHNISCPYICIVVAFVLAMIYFRILHIPTFFITAFAPICVVVNQLPNTHIFKYFNKHIGILSRFGDLHISIWPNENRSVIIRGL